MWLCGWRWQFVPNWGLWPAVSGSPSLRLPAQDGCGGRGPSSPQGGPGARQAPLPPPFPSTLSAQWPVHSVFGRWAPVTLPGKALQLSPCGPRSCPIPPSPGENRGTHTGDIRPRVCPAEWTEPRALRLRGGQATLGLGSGPVPGAWGGPQTLTLPTHVSPGNTCFPS